MLSHLSRMQRKRPKPSQMLLRRNSSTLSPILLSLLASNYHEPPSHLLFPFLSQTHFIMPSVANTKIMCVEPASRLLSTPKETTSF